MNPVPRMNMKVASAETLKSVTEKGSRAQSVSGDSGTNPDTATRALTRLDSKICMDERPPLRSQKGIFSGNALP
jgi:hypothetical protein